MTKNLHIVPDGKGWAVKQEGNPFPLSHHMTQGAAQDAARPLARMLGGELVTHRPNGQIRDKDSFGNDPFPPRDRRH